MNAVPAEKRNSKIENRLSPAAPAAGKVASDPLPDRDDRRGQVLAGSASGLPWLPAGGAGGAALEGAWIEIFRTGDYGERGTWTAADLDQLAASYDPRRHAAPVVLGHPADDAPAYAWVARLRRAGQSLWAQLEKVDPVFEALLRAGRFRQRSVALYTHFPPSGSPYLRHLGFLGAAPPAVKGLAPVRFIEAPSVTLEFLGDQYPATRDQSDTNQGSRATGHGLALSEVEGPRSSEDSMPEAKSKLEAFLDHLRAFFAAAPQAVPSSASVIPSDPDKVGGVEGSAFAERLAQLEQRLESLTAEKQSAEEKLNEAAVAHRQEQIAHFVETLRARGRFPPAFDRWGVPEFMERLAAADAARSNNLSFRAPMESGRGICFSTARLPLAVPSESRGTSRPLDKLGLTEAEQTAEVAQSEPALLAWFQEFLTKLPPVLEFRELTPGPARRHLGVGGSRLVRFTEPRRGMTVDPASVELAERAEALAAELGISYAEALAQLREERRTNLTNA